MIDSEFDRQLVFDNIIHLVKENRLKIGELEAQAGVSTGYISRASKEGGSTPSLEFVARAARALNVSMDMLVTTRISELTATERYLINFIEKLERDTNSDKLNWERETKSMLESLDPRYDQDSYHPLFKFMSYTDVRDGSEMEDYLFPSHSFGGNTAIYGDCFNLQLEKNAVLYLMNISENPILGNTDKTAKELWILNGNKPQYLASTLSSNIIGNLIDSLYNAVVENSKHPKISPELRSIIDAFMRDDNNDTSNAESTEGAECEEDDDLPF